jgi:hypothetical protein
LRVDFRAAALLFEQMTSSGAIEKGDYWRKAFDLSLLGSGLAVPPP